MHECYFIDKIIRNKFCKTRLKRIKNKNVKKKIHSNILYHGRVHIVIQMLASKLPGYDRIHEYTLLD